MGSRSPVKTLVKMLGLSKMRLCVLFFLISVVTSMPQPQGPEEPLENHPEKYVPQDIEMQMLDEEDMKQLLTDLFVAHPKGPRDARQLEGDADESEAADVADVTDEDAEALDTEEPAAAKDDSEARASEEEVARFNNYIDAIYRRMNAALRAKMMDPMTLNLDDKQKRGGKSNKPRSLDRREADDEDEDEDDDKEVLGEDEADSDEKEVLGEDEIQSRAGKAEKKKNKKKGAVARKKNKKNKKARKEKIAKKEAAKKEKQELREKKKEERKKNKEEAERSVSKREADDEVHDAVLAEDELQDRAGK